MSISFLLVVVRIVFLSLLLGDHPVAGYKKCPSNETLNDPQLAELLTLLEFDANGCLCAPNATTGLYGQATNHSSLATVQYLLEGTFVKNDEAAIIQSSLENSFGRVILVHLFPAECSKDALSSSSVMGVAGLSTRTNTTRGAANEFRRTCTPETTTTITDATTSSSCYIVNATITIYYNAAPSSLEVQEMDALVNRIVLQHIEQGDFNDDDDDAGTGKNNITVQLVQDDDEEEAVPWYRSGTFFVALIAVVCICCCCSCVVAINLLGINKYLSGPKVDGMKDKFRSTFKRSKKNKGSSKKQSKSSSGDTERDLEISEQLSDSDDDDDEDYSVRSDDSDSDDSYNSDSS